MRVRCRVYQSCGVASRRSIPRHCVVETRKTGSKDKLKSALVSCLTAHLTAGREAGLPSSEEIEHQYRLGRRNQVSSGPPEESPAELRRQIEPWLSAVLESEHLSLLVGSGLPIGTASALGVEALDMEPTTLDTNAYSREVAERASALAEASGRSSPNIEDQFRAILELISGLRITKDGALRDWEELLSTKFADFAKSVLLGEREIAEKLLQEESSSEGGTAAVVDQLVSFFLTFASRSPVRDRLHVFTTNYDRLVEYICDLAGLWKIDRFVGGLTPRFRASRLDIDLHYNPPGIRGEPRYLEGVIRLTKLHGSIDWSFRDGVLQRNPMPFGCDDDLLPIVGDPKDSLIIYPNAAKDVETGEFPYAELFRDFSAAIVRPNSVLVTYGYGFSDDHINRIIIDMLSIPSTHLMVVSYDDAGGRVSRFLNEVGRESQTSVLRGPSLASLEPLTGWYLPRPSLDEITWREAQLLRRRQKLVHPPETEDEGGAEAETTPNSS